MDDKPEFYELNQNVSNLIRRQLMDEYQFMAYRNFYATDRNKRFRMVAASTIASVSDSEQFCYIHLGFVL